MYFEFCPREARLACPESLSGSKTRGSSQNHDSTSLNEVHRGESVRGYPFGGIFRIGLFFGGVVFRMTFRFFLFYVE